MSEYTETHRHLLQFLMKSGYVEQKKINQILNEYKKKHKYDGRDATHDDFIRTINQKIENLHLAIKVLKHPRTKESYFGLINEQDDEISKLATTYTAQEIAYFKKIVCGLNSF
jgi:hypothetical protein